ncbi:MAG: hypothetical protein WCD79_22055 [Chthoniobacteraceae bacterium]
MLIRTLKYFGLALFGPIVRFVLNLMCRFLRFRTTKAGNWVFFGSAEFIQLVEEAKARLGREDIEMLTGIKERYTVMSGVERTFSFPFWRYGGIPDASIAWGSEGITAQWVYFYFHYVWSTRHGLWINTVSGKPLELDFSARAKTKEWLVAHNFPDELTEPFTANAAE